MVKSKKLKRDITINDLAGMVQKGFLELGGKIDRMEGDIKELKTDVSELKSDVSELKSDVSELKSDVSELKSDMSEVKVDLNRRVHIFDHKDLEFRVEKLEKIVARKK